MQPLRDDDPNPANCPDCNAEVSPQALFCMGCGARLRRSVDAGWPGQHRADGRGELAGEVLLEYVLDHKIGEGGMGAVYVGHHRALGQRVAVKVLHPELARDPALVERFLQEARIQTQLDHPNVVRVLTATTTGPHIAMVLEHIDGISLAEVLERRGALAWEEARALFAQVLAAVEHAHSHGVIHRDIKPANIMITADGTARVMDFGIARIGALDRKTRTGTAMGSAYYMAPEQILGRKDLDHRADIYSLGVTLFEVLTGVLPFVGDGSGTTDSDFLVRQAHVQRDAPDPRTLVPSIPPGVAAAILKAMEKQPQDRFSSCAELARALETAETAPVPAPSPPRPAVASAARVARGRVEAEVTASHAVRLVPASLGRRIMASFLDGLYSVLLGIIPAGALAATGSGSDEAAALGMVALFAVIFLYEFGWIAYLGATPGKRHLGLTVVDARGAPLGVGGALVRTIVKQGAGFFAGIGTVIDVIPGLVSEQRRCLHDLLGGSVVVDQRASVLTAPELAPPAPYPVRSGPPER